MRIAGRHRGGRRETHGGGGDQAVEPKPSSCCLLRGRRGARGRGRGKGNPEGRGEVILGLVLLRGALPTVRWGGVSTRQGRASPPLGPPGGGARGSALSASSPGSSVSHPASTLRGSIGAGSRPATESPGPATPGGGRGTSIDESEGSRLEQGRDIHTSMAGRGRAIDPFSVEEGQGGVPPSPLQLGHEEEEEDGGGDSLADREVDSITWPHAAVAATVSSTSTVTRHSIADDIGGKGAAAAVAAASGSREVRFQAK